MIDYNYYTTLSDKELEKIVSHVKNIQNQRANDFSNSFSSFKKNDLEQSLPTVNKDLLLKNFQNFSSNYSHTPEEFDFYIFLKKNEITKTFDFTNIENSILWRFSNIELLEFFKKEFPDVYENFKSYSIQLHSKEMVAYYLDNQFCGVNINNIAVSNISNSLVSVLLDRNIPKSLDDIKFNHSFLNFNFDTMNQIKNYLNIHHFNLETLCSTQNLNTKDYMKNIFKYHDYKILDLFELNTFFLQEIGKTVDKVDKDISKPFLLHIYDRISKENPEKIEEYLNTIANKIQKPINKEFFSKLKLNAFLSQSLEEKNINQKSLKI